jgi:hypothetical protein
MPYQPGVLKTKEQIQNEGSNWQVRGILEVVGGEVIGMCDQDLECVSLGQRDDVMNWILGFVNGGSRIL